jgi:hypothetical protein
MERRNIFYIIIGVVIIFAVIGIILGYPKLDAAVPEPQPAVDARTSATLWMNPMAIAVPGANPLWFELNDDGPTVISSPEKASLRSFVPWPQSIHITNMLIQENRLVMAVNRLGFLVFIPWDASRLGMYSVVDKAYWSRYSIASLFLHDDVPTALLYRDDFFTLDETVPLPETKVTALIKGSTHPVKAEIPAFADFPSDKAWDIESLKRGKNGAWYFSAAQKSSDMHEKFYYHTKSLDAEPQSISMGDYWLALEPESLRNAPILVQNTVEELIHGGNSSYLIEMLSPNSEQETQYAHHSNTEEADMRSIFVYADDDEALAVFPDGRGATGKIAADDSITTSVFALPKIPSDFFYTGIAISDNTIIASWEEQQSYGVGAAGFVMITSP